MISEIDIADLIHTLATATGRKPTTMARLVTGSGDTLDRINGGLSLTLSRARRIMSNIDSLWPSDLDWPEDIPRPDNSKMSEEKTHLNKNKSHERTQA